ncbi:MAG: Rrf2 family transcriptional regulator [Planctomycetota bacterium]
MPAIYSRSCEYAVRALTRLARLGVGEHCPIRSVGQDETIPLPFLAKIMRDLGKAGLVEAVRGRGGGIRLAKPPTAIRLIDIVDAMDGLESFDRCAVGLAQCDDEVPCALHDRFKPLREAIRSFLADRSLDDMAKTAIAKERSLAAKGLGVRGGETAA